MVDAQLREKIQILYFRSRIALVRSRSAIERAKLIEAESARLQEKSKEVRGRTFSKISRM